MDGDDRDDNNSQGGGGGVGVGAQLASAAFKVSINKNLRLRFCFDVPAAVCKHTTESVRLSSTTKTRIGFVPLLPGSGSTFQSRTGGAGRRSWGEHLITRLLPLVRLPLTTR